MNNLKKTYLLIFSISIAFPLLIIFFNFNNIAINQLLDINRDISQKIQQNFFTILFLYFLIILISTMLNSPGGSIKSILAGFYFGSFYGFLVMIISLTLGSFIIFIINKKIAYEYLMKKITKYQIIVDKYFVKKNPWFFLILIRIIPILPLSIQNIFISTLQIGKLKFLIFTFIGLTPTVLIYTLLGSYLNSIIEIQNFQFINLLSDGLIYKFLIINLIVIFIAFFISKIEDKFKN